jgi:hypothetical protein
MQGVNGNCGNCGPQMAMAQNVQSVEAKQLANQVQMQKVMEKVGKGELPLEEGQKQIAQLLMEQVQLQASLAPGAAGGAAASSPAPASAPRGFSMQDTFEPGPAAGAGRSMPNLMPDSGTSAMGAFPELNNDGGGSKPSIIKN